MNEQLATLTPDLPALRSTVRTEILAFAAEIRLLKRHHRTPPGERGEPPPTRFDLPRSKLGATLVCMLMAHSRGRRHLRVWRPDHPDRFEVGDLAAQAAVLERELGRMDEQERSGYATPLLSSAHRATARAILSVRR
jgi:hypothetical protein